VGNVIIWESYKQLKMFYTRRLKQVFREATQRFITMPIFFLAILRKLSIIPPSLAKLYDSNIEAGEIYEKKITILSYRDYFNNRPIL